jgi:hypothetical protein
MIVRRAVEMKSSLAMPPLDCVVRRSRQASRRRSAVFPFPISGKTEGSCRAAAFIAKLRNSFLRWGVALAISPRGKYSHLLSRAAEKFPELPKSPVLKRCIPGDSGNSGNFLAGPARKNRNFLETGRREPRDLA